MRRMIVAVVGLAAAFLFALPAFGASFTLEQLVNGGVTSFQSDDGSLTFSNFNVTKLKKLPGDLSLYTITTVGDGFTLTSSAFTANAGGLRKLDLAYTVTANSGSITGAMMLMDASRTSGRVKVEKDIDSSTSDEGTFLLTILRNNASILTDSDSFAPGVTTFDVEESIRIKKVSTLNSVQNSYSVTVPEPADAALLLTGLVGLGVFGRRRIAGAR